MDDKFFLVKSDVLIDVVTKLGRNGKELRVWLTGRLVLWCGDFHYVVADTLLEDELLRRSGSHDVDSLRCWYVKRRSKLW